MTSQGLAGHAGSGSCGLEVRGEGMTEMPAERRALPLRLLGKAEAEAWALEAQSSGPGFTPNSPWALKHAHLI